MSNQENYLHLRMIREGNIGTRKSRMVPPKIPNRGGRATFAPKLSEKLNEIVSNFNKKGKVDGINPNFVFRIPLDKKANPKFISESLESLGIFVVSIEPDRAIVAFKDDSNLDDFRRAINIYQNGPKIKKDQTLAKTTQYDFLEFIEVEGMGLWRRNDRIGSNLMHEIGIDGERIDNNKLYIVDIELWHPGNRAKSLDILKSFREFIESDQGKLNDQYIGDFLLLVKVSVLGMTLNKLLDIDNIAEVDLPPSANFDPITIGRTTKKDIVLPASPPKDGPRICIIDSGIVSNHPLLESHIGDAISVLSTSDSPADMYGHGTMVGGIALFGDVRESYESGIFTSSITLYSARVLNEQNRFDDESLIINQLEKAIQYFSSDPYNCTVFNISIGGSGPADGLDKDRQNTYAECIDTLARKYKVLIVVSAGNHYIYRQISAEEALTSYVKNLFLPDAKLCDFATSALAVTVGAIAQYDSVSIRSTTYDKDLYKIIALPNYPSPMTRIGPGVRGCVKPDFVHYGGSPIFDKSIPNQIRDDNGTAVMSLSHEPLNKLFAFNSGTSFAAPNVARLAALIEDSLKREFSIEPHPNLLRAFLAASSTIPQEAESLNLDNRNQKVSDIYGYGIPDDNLAIFSSGSRVSLFAQDTIKPNNFHVYRIPVPDVFQREKGKRKISVCLAFDPPIRKRRFDYLGVEMKMMVIRDTDLGEVLSKMDKYSGEDDEDLSQEENEDNLEQDVAQQEGKSKKLNKLIFKVRANSLKKSTLQKGIATFSRDISKYGDEYFLIIQAENKWLKDEDIDYAVVLTLECSNEELYTKVQQRIEQRARVRV